MKPCLHALLARGQRSVALEGMYVRRGRGGHILLRDVSFRLGGRDPDPLRSGEEDHVWLNRNAYAAVPDFDHLRPGDRIMFIADLQVIRKRSGERSVRLECAREVRRLSRRDGSE